MKDPDDSIEMVLDHILSALDILAIKAVDRDQYDEVAPYRNRLRQVSVRAETVERLIAAREPRQAEDFPPMKTVLGIAALSAILLGGFALYARPAQEQARQITVAEDDEDLPLQKSDRLPLQVATDSNPVALADRFMFEAPARTPPVIVLQEKDKPSAAPRGRRHKIVNTCTRHHMRRVETRGGKSWRCRH